MVLWIGILIAALAGTALWALNLRGSLARVRADIESWRARLRSRCGSRTFLDAVYLGLARDRERRAEQAIVGALRARFDQLTAREHAILTQVAAGRLNKQIAADMSITETTVKVHRSNAMRKIKAASLAELCRMVDKLNLLAKPSETVAPPAKH